MVCYVSLTLLSKDIPFDLFSMESMGWLLRCFKWLLGCDYEYRRSLLIGYLKDESNECGGLQREREREREREGPACVVCVCVRK